MKNFTRILIALLLAITVCNTASAVNETKTVGATGADYPNLTAAFWAIRNAELTGAITLQIIDNTTETATAILYASGMTGLIPLPNYTSVLIYPTVTGKRIYGNIALPLIEFVGADNVTIDGRLYTGGVPGATPDLTIVNQKNSTTSGTTGASTIKFSNDATNNKIIYCNIKGATMDPFGGDLVFSSGDIMLSGNDGNKIDHNNFTGYSTTAKPTHMMYLTGSAGLVYNSQDTISNNNFYDFFNLGSNAPCIKMSLYNTDWIISGNSFYQTTTFSPSSSVDYTVIAIMLQATLRLKIII